MIILNKLTTLVLVISIFQYQLVSCFSFGDIFNSILNSFGFRRPTYRLSYFNITGRAEFIRWIFAGIFFLIL
jgi:hypothetical protein